MALFSFAKKAPGWVAISLHAERVDLAHVCRGANGRPEVKSLDSFRKEPSDAETLSILRKRRGLAGHRCITALNAGDYQVLQVEAPDVPPAELKDAVRWRIKDMIDYSPETATIDLAAVPSAPAGGSRSRSLYVFSARNEAIRTRMALFDGAKIPLEAIDVPEMALRNVAALWAAPGRTLALLSFDESGGMLVITAGGELYSSRRIELTETQLADPDEARHHTYFERVGLELQRSFDHFDRQFGAVPLSKLIVAAPTAPELAEYLAGNLYVPVEVADLAKVMDFPAVPELRNAARQAQCLVSLGLALREDEA